MGKEVMTGAKNRILLFAFSFLFSLVLGVHFCFALTTQCPSLTISIPIDYDAPQTCLSPSNFAHYDYDTPGKLLACTTFFPSESPLYEKVSFLDFLSGQGGKELSFDPKQIGKKFGEHRDVTRPGYRTHQEYLDKAKQMMNDPNAKVNKFPSDSPKYPGETHIQSGNDLLRLDPNGNFRSLYPLE